MLSSAPCDYTTAPYRAATGGGNFTLIIWISVGLCIGHIAMTLVAPVVDACQALLLITDEYAVEEILSTIAMLVD